MQDPDLFFVVPTYRLRDVGETLLGRARRRLHDEPECSGLGVAGR